MVDNALGDLMLEKLSLDELKRLQADVAEAIDGHQRRRVADARKEIEAVAQRYGLSLSDVIAARPVREKKKIPQRYVNPHDPRITWSGLGRKPRWIIDGLAAGKSLEDFAIGKASSGEGKPPAKDRPPQRRSKA